MSTPLSQMPKPDAGQYQSQRKLFLVPTFAFVRDLPEEAKALLDRYWSEVRDHVHNLERSLGSATHVYHEMVFTDGDDGMAMLEELNPRGYSFIQAMCRSTARLEATEDRELVAESSDWQRCISVGLVSQKVFVLAVEGLQEATRRRFEHMGLRMDETLLEREVGVLFVSENHRIQFPSGIQVFYVSPPSLDALKRWINEQIRPPDIQRAPESEEPTM